MRRPEETLHRAIVQQLRLRLEPPWLFFHVPNGGGRSKAEAGALKAMGVLAGVPDLLLIGPRHRRDPDVWESGADVIAVEVKAPPKPGSKAKPRISEAQRNVIQQLGRCGVPTLVVTSVDATITALRELGVPLKGRTL